MQPITPSPLTPFSLTQSGITPTTPAQQKEMLKGQVEEFASLLYAQMFEEMREAGKSEDDEENSVFGGGDTDAFMHFMDEAVGKNFMHQGGGSLGDSLYKQLSRNLDAKKPAGGAQ